MSTSTQRQAPSRSARSCGTSWALRQRAASGAAWRSTRSVGPLCTPAPRAPGATNSWSLPWSPMTSQASSSSSTTARRPTSTVENNAAVYLGKERPAELSYRYSDGSTVRDTSPSRTRRPPEDARVELPRRDRTLVGWKIWRDDRSPASRRRSRALGRTGVGGATEVRTPGVVGARVPWATDNHWVDAAVADAGAELVEPPHCVWSAVVPEGRREIAEIAMPCMGLVSGLTGEQPSAASVETPSLAVVGELNDRAYGQRDRLGPLIGAIVDAARAHARAARGRRVGVRRAHPAPRRRRQRAVRRHRRRFRRRGLAAQVVGAALAEARDDGVRTATLQASPDGFGVYERLGFRTVATLRASRA